MSQFVDEGLGHERQRIAMRSAQGTRADPQVDHRSVQRVIRDEGLRELGCSHAAGADDALLVAFAIAVGDEVIPPRDHLARRVQAGLQELVPAGTIVVVLHIVFARPQQLDRASHELRDVGRFRA